ncbi:Com family DNA-binding transcriptional regulator [Rhodoferax fermentans]|nr:Com family DNA-binding transcriptional regulator [Rhodoferax fermentans]MBK1683379.1 Com family DNA-binding transcriptional regulator [Rhodoferax fermentans]
MQEVRCGACGKLLAIGDYKRLQIKCPRCRVLNDLRAESLQPERLRASSKNGLTDDDRTSSAEHLQQHGRSGHDSGGADGAVGRRKAPPRTTHPAGVS